MNLSDLKIKYRLGAGAKYEPDPQCKHCRGSGEAVKAGRPSFCACLFFDPTFREEALGLIAQSVCKAFPSLVATSSDQQADAQGEAGSASNELLGGAVGGDSASGAAVNHGSAAIRSGGDQPTSPLAHLASPGKSGSNLTAATGTFATSRAVLAEADRSDALPEATSEPNPSDQRAGGRQP